MSEEIRGAEDRQLIESHGGGIICVRASVTHPVDNIIEAKQSCRRESPVEVIVQYIPNKR
jgi:hypothetical protein